MSYVVTPDATLKFNWYAWPVSVAPPTTCVAPATARPGTAAAVSADQPGLGPLSRGRYFRAARGTELETAPVARLIESLQSPEFGRLARSLAGYKAAAAGSVVGVEALGSDHA